MWRKLICVRQNDQSDCGVAALATVARHYGMRCSVEHMRDLAGTDRMGVNLLGLQAAAERLGFVAKAVKGTIEALPVAPLPAIAHVKNDQGLGHFVVLYRVARGHVVFADPAYGLRTVSRDEFGAMWSGYLLLVAPESSARTAKTTAATMTPWMRFVTLLTFHRGVLLEAVACAVLMTLLGIATSYFIQHLVDSVLVRGESRLLNALGIGMAAILVFRTLFGVVRQYLLAFIGRRVDLSLVSSYTRHLLSLPVSFFEMRRVGEILSRVNDAGKVREAVGGATLTAAVDGVLVVFTTLVLWMYDTPLAVLATAISPVLVAAVALHHPMARRRSREAMESGAELTAHLVEDVSGVETIKAYGAQRRRGEQGETRLVGLAQSMFSLQMLSLSMSTAGGVVTGIAGLAILWYGGHRVIAGALTIGELMFFYTLLGYMLEPLQRLATVNHQLQEALVAVDRLYQIMDLQIEDDGREKARLPRVAQSIELCDVRFGYGCRGNVLEGINLTIRTGARVAIVGESGCGKSTLLKLLMRFYDPTGGRVLVDGVDMRDYDLASLRGRIGLVSQDAFVFSGTVRENILLGDPHASLNDVIEAARAADLDEFIAGLPERYETVIGERGANLSGGQRQRLAIARALLRKPDIVLFDEATSHLDTVTERAIQFNLRSALAGRTVVVVAHRLSTIRDADLICVMDQGRIVEQGTHRELLANEGRYAALWRSQMDERPSEALIRGNQAAFIEHTNLSLAATGA